MIYTCTLNQAIDLFIETDKLQPEVVNRTNNYDIIPNGKGVNVSFIMKMLGVDSVALGVGGGFTSKFIEESLEEKGIKTNFTHIDGISRINVFTRVLNPDSEYKEVNKGPKVSKEKVQEFLEIVQTLTKDDKLVVSGSFSTGILPQLIVKIAKMSQEQGFDLIIDTSYPEILSTFSYHPFLIKPNDAELFSWLKVEHTDDLSKLSEYVKEILSRGAKNILLSLGAKGAIFGNRDGIWFGNAPKVNVVNTACSGDTMLGTFLAGMERGQDINTNLKQSLAAASSTAATSGLTDFSDLDSLLNQIKVYKI
ncbi:1-phosphofructokinase [Companilactobacillus jidongensis]|uniref:1-phosphofructokinase n=1 Tax=Companilactobacillus jidongensis TaxID=2486006 RepID=UPI000F7B9075|nr:1-phosphofructokinase [Companilactobacillus jidongensis]